MTIRKLHHAITIGNLSDLKQLINSKLSTCRDKGGRSLLHKSVMFERSFITKYLLKEFREIVHIKDNVSYRHFTIIAVLFSIFFMIQRTPIQLMLL